MIYLVIGRREQGKTTLAYWMAERQPQQLVFDPRNMIMKGTRCHDESSFQGACDRLLDQQLKTVVFSPRGNLQAGFEVYAAEVQRFIEQEPDRPIAFLVDEANKDFINTDVDSFQWAIRCCSREVHHIMMTAHRPVDFHTKIRALADHWCLFAIRQEDDLNKVRERCSPEVVQLVQRLEQRQFIHWNDAKGTYEAKLDPTTWRVEIGRPRYVELPGDDSTGGLSELPSSDQEPARIDTPRLF
jgi:hypothetical protein